MSREIGSKLLLAKCSSFYTNFSTLTSWSICNTWFAKNQFPQQTFSQSWPAPLGWKNHWFSQRTSRLPPRNSQPIFLWKNASILQQTLECSQADPPTTLRWPKMNFANKVSPDVGYHHFVGKIIKFANKACQTVPEKLATNPLFAKCLTFPTNFSILTSWSTCNT